MVLCAGYAYGATIFLEAFVFNNPGAILSSNGVPLADGSIVQIMGSDDNVADGFVGSGTNLTPNQAAAGETIIGTVTIDSTELGSNGTFYSAEFTFESTEVNYLYLRVFDSPGPLTGMINYAFSDVFTADDDFSTDFQDFGGGFATTNFANFVIIPEPGTAHMLLVFLALALGMRSAMRKRHLRPARVAGHQPALQTGYAAADEDLVRDWI